jgi:hypothetical protein
MITRAALPTAHMPRILIENKALLRRSERETSTDRLSEKPIAWGTVLARGAR